MNRRRIEINGEDRSYNDLFQWVGVPGVAYLPATTVPVGLTSEGLPVGIQVVGPYLEDRTAMHLAGAILRESGGFRAPPGF